jgi:tripartite ATP-independent transporter DctM subunit
MMNGLIPLIVLAVLFVVNTPAAYCLIASTVTYFLFINNSLPVDMVFQRMFASTESFSLMAIPFFVTAGCIMNYSGISEKLMAFAEVLTGHMQGGLAQVDVLLSTFMGGVSGSANADAAMESKILVPPMVKRGYSPAFSTAVTASSAIISPIIPPGLGLIIYASLANASIGKLFIAGYIPGIMMCVFLMVVVHHIAKKRGYKPNRERHATKKEILHQLKDSSWALFLPFGIIFALRVGIATPTEAGALCVLYSMLVGIFVYKKLTFRQFGAIMIDSLVSTACVMFIICAANAFGYYMSWESIPQHFSAMLISLTSNKYLMLFLINMMLLFIGMFIEGTAVLIIVVPLLMSIITTLHIDLVHFGIIAVLNLCIGGITLPFGTLMFLTCSIAEVRVVDFVKEIWPMLAALLLVLFIVTYCPMIITFLPNLIMGA